jgi:hypothetical protein
MEFVRTIVECPQCQIHVQRPRGFLASHKPDRDASWKRSVKLSATTPLILVLIVPSLVVLRQPR